MAARAPNARDGIPDSLDDHFGSAVTHAAAALATFPAHLVLLYVASTQGQRAVLVCAAVYGTMLVALFATSALYHSMAALSVSLRGIHEASRRQFGIASIPVKATASYAARGGLRRLDYVFILLFAAAAVTPLLVATLGLEMAWGGLRLVWLYALFGVVYEALLRPFLRYGIVVYAGLGLVVGYALVPALPVLGPEVLHWLTLAAGCLGVGLAFFWLSFLPLHHSVWHLAVIGFAACHYVAVLYAIAGVGDAR